MRLLALSEKDVLNALPSAQELVALVRATLIAYSAGLIDCPPKIGIFPPRSRHIHAMPAFLPHAGAVGLKWIADYPANKSVGLPSGPAIIVLNDVDTGMPISIVNGDSITATRTAIVSAVALIACAAPGASVAALVGTGVEAKSHAVYLPLALPQLSSLRIVGRTLDRAKQFCDETQPHCPIPLIPVSSIEESVMGADIVVTVTTTTTVPLLKLVWLKPGATVEVLDNGGKEQELLDGMDAIFTDSRRQFASDETQRLYHHQTPGIRSELGEVLAQKHSGRESEQQRILLLNLGLGACDIAVAHEVYERAGALGLGSLVEL